MDEEGDRKRRRRTRTRRAETRERGDREDAGGTKGMDAERRVRRHGRRLCSPPSFDEGEAFRRRRRWWTRGNKCEHARVFQPHSATR